MRRIKNKATSFYSSQKLISDMWQTQDCPHVYCNQAFETTAKQYFWDRLHPFLQARAAVEVSNGVENTLVNYDMQAQGLDAHVLDKIW